MKNSSQFKENFGKIKGKTVAIVYIFEGDTSSGFEHFYIWKSNIIAKWMNAVQELSCLPLIIDVRTFIDKAINKTLPHIDYVLNLNSGTYDLSVMALIPAMCSSINVPCIPCNAVSIVTGENKLLSNQIASSLGINVPAVLSSNDTTGIFRPISLGNSLGVQRGSVVQNIEGIYQQFIEGCEVTTPLVYNALTKKMEVLPSVAFVPNDNDPTWYYGANDKKMQQGYHFELIDIDEKTKGKYLKLAHTLEIQTYCRIDSRVKCKGKEDMIATLKTGATDYNTYFIEINVMPTIRDNNSFCYSFDSLTETNPIYECLQLQNADVGTININSFLLASAMLSFV